MIVHTLLLTAGIALLYLGSEWMVRGASALAISFYIRPVIIGLTIVAFATSAPELMVSLIAAVKGSSGVSLGNILGSNVANMGLVLGASALVKPQGVDRGLLTREIPFMLGVSGLFWLICLDGYIGRLDGVLLLCALGGFLIMGFLTARTGIQITLDQPPLREAKNILWQICLILLGLGGLMAGAHMIVNSAIFIAQYFGLSEIFIGLSIVAVGTSLPELATSVVAGAKGEHDISIGNVVGSNVFNVCMVIGAVGAFNPMTVDIGAIQLKFAGMMAISFILFLFCRTGYGITRLEGFLLLLCFFGFIALSFWL
ncbi:MAG: calcium/sodium antiporter [Desulfatiglandaceae bacterium]